MGTNPSIQIVHNHNNKLETVSISELLQNRQHAQISQLWANFDIWGLLYCPLLPTRAKFGVVEHTHGLHLQATFRLDQFIFFAVWRERPKILPFYWLRHFLASAVGGNLRKLNTGAQLQTIPYPMVSKLFLYSNAFMAKSCKIWQTNKKIQRFWPTQWRVKSEPHQTSNGDRGPRASSFTSKTFADLTHIFTTRGR